MNRLNYPERWKAELILSSTWGLKTIDIEPIHANTPQRPRTGSNEPTRSSRIAWSRNCVWPASRTLDRQPTPTHRALYARLQSALRQVTAKPWPMPIRPDRLLSTEERDLILEPACHAQARCARTLTVEFKNREYQLTGQRKKLPPPVAPRSRSVSAFDVTDHRAVQSAVTEPSL